MNLDFSADQLAAIQDAETLLQNAGISVLSFIQFQTHRHHVEDHHDGPSDTVRHAQYVSPPATPFTAEDIRIGRHRVTREQTVQAFIEHPYNAIVEFPQSGASSGESVAHRQKIDTNHYMDPRDNVQFSIYKHHSTRKIKGCFMLDPSTEGNKPMECMKFTGDCKS